MKFLLFITAAVSCALPACKVAESIPPSVVEVVSQYGIGKYMAASKTAATWTKRHTELAKVNADLILANTQGLTAATLATIAAQFTDNSDVQALVKAAASFIPASAQLAKNYPYVTALTDGVTAALAAPSPFV